MDKNSTTVALDMDAIEADRAMTERCNSTKHGGQEYRLATVHVPALVARVRELEAERAAGTERVRATIVARAGACSDSCNSHHINHVLGQIRGLAWALLGGDIGDCCNVGDVFSACGIPFEIGAHNKVSVPSAWLAEHRLSEDWRLL